MNHLDLFPILPFLSSFFEEFYWKECLKRLKKNIAKLPAGYQTENSQTIQTMLNMHLEF